jgi:hypothetical protein
MENSVRSECTQLSQAFAKRIFADTEEFLIALQIRENGIHK